MTTASLVQRLSAHLARSPNESDRARARLHLLDWLACVAGARGSAALFAWFYPIISAAPLSGGKMSYEQWMWLRSWR